MTLSMFWPRLMMSLQIYKLTRGLLAAEVEYDVGPVQGFSA